MKIFSTFSCGTLQRSFAETIKFRQACADIQFRHTYLDDKQNLISFDTRLSSILR